MSEVWRPSMPPDFAEYLTEQPGQKYAYDEDWAALIIGERETVPGPVRVAVLRFMFTAAVVTFPPQPSLFYLDRWCYHSTKAAVRAAEEWIAASDAGEPSGWHRHPRSGRRRPGGDPIREYLNP